jgi:hypothetical protein
MDYQMRPPGKTCFVTGEPLQPGTLCYSVLIDHQGALERRDISSAAWTGPPENTIGVWQRIVPAPRDLRMSQLDPREMQRYFEQLVEEAQPARERLVYVLALYLLQKRKLQLEGSRRDGDIEYLQLSAADGSGSYEIRDQQLSGAEVSALQQELTRSIAAEWAA